MYLINYNVAFSDDCINWTPVVDDKGHLMRVLPPRAGGGKFDCNLIEPGPPPVVTPKGILVICHGGENDPKHELAFILGKRMFCLKVNGRKEEADAIYEKIKQLLPSASPDDIAGAFVLN